MKEGFLDEKWKKLLKLSKKFRYVPFVDFVLVSGSMAMGEAKENSDFDFIVGSRQGRIFTSRQFTAGFFELISKRRKKDSNEKEAKDKACFNHYVTSKGYRLDPPYNEYWISLYQKLVPVYGDRKLIESFLRANDWAGEIEIDYKLLSNKKNSLIKKIGEFFLKGRLGNFLESKFKEYQVKRIEKNLKKTKTYKPLIKYDDTELRFHIDTRRIEEWIENNKSRAAGS
jgi:predicted nucleotidyltransferase